MLKYFCILIAGLYVIPSFGCGEGCTSDECCVQACGIQCYLDPRYGTSCVCDEPEPEPEIPWCEHGQYLEWNSQNGSWFCKNCPSKYPDSDGAYYHITNCYLMDDEVCGGTCFIHKDRSYCFGNASGKHLEYDANDNLVCVNNNVPCSDFNASGCVQSGQVGNAHYITIWNTDNEIHNPWEYYIHDYNAWDVSECKCEQSANFPDYKCSGGRTLGLSNNIVTDLLGRGPYEQAVYSRKDSIKYNNVGNYYCTHCNEGTKPRIFNKNSVPRPYNTCKKDDAGNFIACACEDVEADYYSIGCDLPNYPWTTQPDVPAACHTQCPAHTTTNDVTGATDVNQCIPDGAMTYCDSVGCFKLGQDSSLCD